MNHIDVAPHPTILREFESGSGREMDYRWKLQSPAEHDTDAQK